MISFFLVLIGVFWIADTEPFKTYGTIFLIVGGIVLFIHILIGLFVGTNHFVEEKRKEETLYYKDMKENEPTPQIYYVDLDNSDDDNL